MSEEVQKDQGLAGLVETIQTGGEGTPPERPEASVTSETSGERKKTWQKLAPGESPSISERVKCRDGEGIVDRIEGPNVLTRLDSGYFNYAGIDQIQVLR